MKNEMVIKGNWNTFLDMEGEILLLVARKHLFRVIFPLLVTWLVASIFMFAAFFIFIHVIYSIPLLVLSLMLILSLGISLAVYSWVYWYFHLYILTNRKILEVMYTPLYSHVVNDIFLDKVNCTEIDLSSKGFFHELIDMGDLTITFDRPTHQEEFVLQDIKDCDEIGKFLTQKLLAGREQVVGEMIWVRGRDNLARKAVV